MLETIPLHDVFTQMFCAASVREYDDNMSNMMKHARTLHQMPGSQLQNQSWKTSHITQLHETEDI